MRRYFEGEMRLLREAGEAYAETYPEQARALGLSSAHDRDPYVERMLEGFAFLTAQIRQRIDAAHETTANDLLDAYAPDLVRPYPSATILRFSPGRRQQGLHRIPAQTTLTAPEHGEERVRCRFRTTRPLDIFPLALESLVATETLSGGTRFTLTFQYEGDEAPSDLPLGRIPFFIDADRPLALAMHRLWTSALKGIRVRSDKGRELAAGPLAFRPGGLDADNAVNGSLSSARPALRLLHDYFGFRSRFLFVELTGLDSVQFGDDGFSRFVLEFETERGLPRDHRLSERNLVPFCVPGVNLFPCEGKPLSLDGTTHEFEVRAEEERRGTLQVHSVTDVDARGRASAEIRRLRPLRELIGHDEQHAWYAVERRDLTGGAPDSWLRVGGLPLEESHTLSLDLLATQGNLPRRYVRSDELQAAGQALPAGIGAHTQFRPTAWSPPPGEFPVNRLYALLRTDLEELLETESLRDLLRALEWQGAPDDSSRIQSLEKLSGEPFQMVRNGLLTTGIRVRVELREELGFSSLDDIHLFGEVLHAFFQAISPMNQAIETHVLCQPSGRSFRWRP